MNKLEEYQYKIIRCEYQIDQFLIDKKTGKPIEETRNTIKSYGSYKNGRSALLHLQRENKDWIDTDYELVCREVVKGSWESPF